MRTTTGLTLLLIGIQFARGQSPAPAPDLETRLARAITNVSYRAPARTELARARTLFVETLRGDRPVAELKPRWAQLGFGFHELRAGSEPVWLVAEEPGHELGRGWYVFRTNRISRLALEAPHARNDIHTGAIALRLFLSGDSRALAASTITRHRADMAHLDDTYFQAFTLAFADVCPTGLVVQIHGFEAENYNGTRADIIASAGTRETQPWLGEVVGKLGRETSLVVLAYSRDTQHLGATRNAQGQALRHQGRCRFLHLEMTRQLRDRLMRDQKLRDALFNSLATAQER